MATLEQVRAPAKYALAVVRGDSISVAFRIVSGSTGARVPLTGWDGYALVNPSPGNAEVFLEFDVDVSQDAAGLPGTGLITMSADADETSMLRSGVWRLVLTMGDVSKAIVAGEFCVSEPFAGASYRSNGCAVASGSGCGESATTCGPGSCGYSETLGMEIPCGPSACSVAPVASAVGEVEIRIGC